MSFKESLTHPYRIVHGGAIASLADSSVAMALISLVEPNDRFTTIEFKIHFFAPVNKGTLRAHGEIIQKGSKVAVGEDEIKNDEGKLIAKVIATSKPSKIRRISYIHLLKLLAFWTSFGCFQDRVPLFHFSYTFILLSKMGRF